MSDIDANEPQVLVLDLMSSRLLGMPVITWDISAR